MRYAVIGSRNFPVNPITQELYYLDEFLDNNILYLKEDVIVSGGAKGADTAAERWALKHGVKTQIFRPRWHDSNGNYNPRAGFERNTTIIENCDKVLALWDGVSNGTRDSIRKALSLKKPVIIMTPHGIEISPDSEVTGKIGNIWYVGGDMLLANIETLVNPCNTVGIAGAGLSLHFKNFYPLIINDYAVACYKHIVERGKLYINSNKEYPGRKFIHFPTKTDWRQPSQLEYVEEGLVDFVKNYEQWHLKSVAFPRLGCGLGGLNWKADVQPLMQKYLNDVNIPVFIFV